MKDSVLDRIEHCFVPAGARRPAGGVPQYEVALVQVTPNGLVARLLSWLALPLRVAACERAMRKNGATVLGRYALFPGIEHPALIYELHTPAAEYAETRLLQTATQMRCRRLRAALSAWTCCDPAVGGVVVIGRMP